MRQYSFVLALLLVVVYGCASKQPQPARAPIEPTPRASVPEVKPTPPTPVPQTAPPPPPAVVEKSLDSILTEYTRKWRQDYPMRRQLAGKCATTTGYSYGMRMLQPASFQGDFAEAVKKKYGNTTDFIVIAVAKDSAAAKLQIVEGDRIIQVGKVKSTQPNAGKLLGGEVRKWSTPYDVVVMRDGKPVTMKLKPDRICEIPL